MDCSGRRVIRGVIAGVVCGTLKWNSGLRVERNTVRIRTFLARDSIAYA